MNDNNMSDTPFFSVLMLTYNSSWNKTRQTLYSVLVQKDVSFEIIIADDGSEENNFEKICDYLAAWNFTAYSLVANERNQGIVRNFNSGLVLCKGEYIKLLSPGDFLYDENTLSAYREAIIRKRCGRLFWQGVFLQQRSGYELQKYLEESGVGTNIHYPIPPYKQECYRGWKRMSLLLMERIYAEKLSLPMRSCLMDEQVRRVIDVVNGWRK